MPFVGLIIASDKTFFQRNSEVEKKSHILSQPRQLTMLLLLVQLLLCSSSISRVKIDFPLSETRIYVYGVNRKTGAAFGKRS